MTIFSDAIRWRWMAVASLLDGLVVAFMGSAGFGVAIGWAIGLMIFAVVLSSIPIYLYKVLKKKDMPGIPSFVWTVWALMAFFLTLQEASFY